MAEKTRDPRIPSALLLLRGKRQPRPPRVGIGAPPRGVRAVDGVHHHVAALPQHDEHRSVRRAAERKGPKPSSSRGV